MASVILFLLSFHLGGTVAIFMISLPLTGEWARSFTNGYYWPIWVTRLFIKYWRNK